MTVDIAHPPLSDPEAEAVLDRTLQKVRRSDSLRAFKVIHGFGALGAPAAQKLVVDKWIRANRNRIISSIDGEELNSSNASVQVLLAACDLPPSNDFRYPNGEITIIWVT